MEDERTLIERYAEIYALQGLMNTAERESAEAFLRYQRAEPGSKRELLDTAARLCALKGKALAIRIGLEMRVS